MLLDNSLLGFWDRQGLQGNWPDWAGISQRNWVLLAPRSHLLPKNLTMALLYIFHVEHVLAGEAWDSQSLLTHKALRSFGNWVDCCCGCGRQWNFANGLGGLRDDRRITVPCIPGAWKDTDDQEGMMRRSPEAPGMFKTNVKEWYATQEHPVIYSAREL